MSTIELPRVQHRYADVWVGGGTVRVYREAGPPDRPPLLLLHGFPSASHQFRRLIDLDRPERQLAQVALALDDHSNVELYPSWQQWLRDHQPPALIVWGRNDPFFPEAGARAYLGDLPDAELHSFDTGHFALEEKLPEIVPLIQNFLDRTLSQPPHARHEGR